VTLRRASPAALKAAGRAELRGLAAALRKAKPGESVHGARRQIKRLRSLARLLRPAMGEEAFQDLNGALKRAADALAGQRRAEALAGVAARLGRKSPAAAQYWRNVAEMHRAAHAGDSPPHGALLPAREAIAEADQRLAAVRLGRSDAALVARAFARTYGRARKRLRRGFASGDVEALHSARKFVIHHLHHLDLLSGVLPPQAKRLAALERLREALGDLNDLDELERLAKAGPASPGPEAALVMDRARAKHAARARKAARPLFRRKTKAYVKQLIAGRSEA
jgi:CHAD domain-containing protein